MYANDSVGFNRLLEGVEATMWNGGCYDWWVNLHGQRMALLIMADTRVRRGEWVLSHTCHYHLIQHMESWDHL